MRKLLHRPAIAAAAALSVIFLIILMKLYLRMLQISFPALIEENEQNDFVSKSVEKLQKEEADNFIGPQLPSQKSISPKQQSSISTTKKTITFR